MQTGTMDFTMRTLLLCAALMTMVAFTSCNEAKGNTTKTSDEAKLREVLLKDYDRSTRPRSDAHEVVNIDVSMWLWQLKELNEQDEVFKVFGFLRSVWKDEFLQWEPEEYSNITSMVISASDIWVPDVYLENSANTLVDSSFYEDFRVDVSHTGEVLWAPGGAFQSICVLDVTFFPFDSQRCKMRFANAMYNGLQQNLSSKMGVVLDKYTENGEWSIVRTEVEVFDNYFANMKPYPTLDCTIYLKRKPLYHAVHMIAPCIIFTLLVTFVFLLPPDSGEKISMGITVLLAFSVFLLMIATQIPKKSDSVPLIAHYLAAVMGFSACSIILTVVILRMHHHDAVSPVPRWLRYVAFEILSKVVFLQRYKSFSSKEYFQVSRNSENKAKASENTEVNISDENENKDGSRADCLEPKKMMDEWQTVALILDRVLFFMYLVVLLIFCIYLLVLPAVATTH